MEQYNQKIAFFAGSFDPITLGHEEILRRALTIFDKIIVAVGVNVEKHSYFTLEQRLKFIQETFSDESRISVETYNGLTINFVQSIGATHLLRGLRSPADFEFERVVAQANRQASGIDTVFLISAPEFSHISSTVVRDFLRCGGDASMFIPKKIRHLVK